MQTLARFFFLLFLGCRLGEAQSADSNVHDIATTWPGIHYQVFHVERIAGNRLLFGLKVIAAPDAAAGGTLIGVEVPIPKNATNEMIATGIYRPRAFSIESATLTDETTQQTYAALKPDPTGPNYVGGKILATLHPNEGRVLTLEFPVPPPPENIGGVPAKQTVSLLLPKARGPISGIVLPPVALSR